MFIFSPLQRVCQLVHPKSLHLAQQDCKFFMKADMDAYVHVPRLLETLRKANASARIYAGQVTLSHGPSYRKWTEFAHGLGYILSSAALRFAVPGLRRCMKQLLDVRLEAIEDMLLAACLRHVDIYPVALGPIIYDFKLTDEHVDRVVKEALVTHRVEVQEMYLLHEAVTKIVQQQGSAGCSYSLRQLGADSVGTSSLPTLPLKPVNSQPEASSKTLDLQHSILKHSNLGGIFSFRVVQLVKRGQQTWLWGVCTHSLNLVIICEWLRWDPCM